MKLILLFFLISLLIFTTCDTVTHSTISTSTTASTSDVYMILTTTADVTLTLPSTSLITGRRYLIKRIQNASAYNAYIQLSGSDTFDAGKLNSQQLYEGQFYEFIADDSRNSWDTFSRFE